MAEQRPDTLHMKDEIIDAFRPIEQLFKIMDNSTLETDGLVLQHYGEIGLALTANFRNRFEKLFPPKQAGSDNE
jgi:hypothetical protein